MVFSNSCFVNSCESERTTTKIWWLWGEEGTIKEAWHQTQKLMSWERQLNFEATKLFSHEHALMVLWVKIWNPRCQICQLLFFFHWHSGKSWLTLFKTRKLIMLPKQLRGEVAMWVLCVTVFARDIESSTLSNGTIKSATCLQDHSFLFFFLG